MQPSAAASHVRLLLPPTREVHSEHVWVDRVEVCVELLHLLHHAQPVRVRQLAEEVLLEGGGGRAGEKKG